MALHFHLKVKLGVSLSLECTRRLCAASIQLPFPIQPGAAAESIVCFFFSCFVFVFLQQKELPDLQASLLPFALSHRHSHHLSINGTALKEVIHLISNQLACYHQQ